MKKEKGVFLIELIVSILIIGILLLIFITTFNASFKELNFTKKQNNISKNMTITYGVISLINNDIISHPFNIKPVIHKKGELNYTDLAEHKYSNRVNVDFSPISYLSLNFKDILKVSAKVKIQEFSACELFKNAKFTKSRYRSVLGISNNSFYELKIIDVKKTNYKPDCFLLKLKEGRSLVLKSDNLKSIMHINYLVPIKGVYTYFIDKLHTLRYLTSVNEEVLENQPVKDNMNLFTLNISNNEQIASSNNFHISLRSKINFQKNKNLNFLLNLNEI